MLRESSYVHTLPGSSVPQMCAVGAGYRTLRCSRTIPWASAWAGEPFANLALEQVEEGLHRRVVVAGSATAHEGRFTTPPSASTPAPADAAEDDGVAAGLSRWNDAPILANC